MASNNTRQSRVIKTSKKRGRAVTSNVLAMFNRPQIAEFKEAFNMIDTDGDGFIGKDDLLRMLLTLGQNPSEEYVAGMLDEAKAEINFTMFLSMFGHRLQGACCTDPEKTIINAFSCFDHENTGVLKVEYLREMLTTMGDCLTDDEVDELLSDMPVKDGLIDYREITRVLKKGNSKEKKDEVPQH
ncbi:myosin regulatory light chain sqh-like [Anopheles ziemanni]|uniref:myosin regulatory light chain sqh-like n=1 Tax=Anopheles coustani TaxID=139045 RepID=UPI00265B592C|nr:myosin regulatory light chain sqh-like [Anopheles coustani]XP_058170349.1 myosin regulatory light chain sqh-like [Anopheles ziemanni]